MQVEAPFIVESDKKELLRRLAYHIQAGAGSLAGNSITHDELQDIFENYLEERYLLSPDRAKTIAVAMIKQFRTRNFILFLYAPNSYCFVHRAFLEYFCASAFRYKFETKPKVKRLEHLQTQEMSLRDLKRDLFGAHWEDSNWHEVLSLVCGMLDERFAGELIDYVANKVYEPRGFRQRHLLIGLAVKCFSELRSINTALVPGLQFLLCDYAIKDEDVEIRRKAVEALGKYFHDDKETLPLLRDRAIKDEDDRWRVRKAAIAMLNRYFKENHETKEIFLDRAAHDESPQVRSAAIYALARLFQNDEGIIQFLQDRIALEVDGPTRSAAVRELGEYFHDDARTPYLLREYVAKDQHWQVRYMAIRGLVKHFRDEQTRRLFIDCATNDPSPSADAPNDQPYVRDTALKALDKYWKHHPDTRAVLLDREQNDSTPWVRELAKQLLKGYIVKNSRTAN
jgi:hypothetical protein